MNSYCYYSPIVVYVHVTENKRKCLCAPKKNPATKPVLYIINIIIYLTLLVPGYFESKLFLGVGELGVNLTHVPISSR